MKKFLFFLPFICTAAFAQVSDAVMRARSIQIRDETRAERNTAVRVGTLFLNLSENKVNLISGITATGTDVYSASVSSSITSYVDGFKVDVKFTNANTGPATLNLNSIGAKDIVQTDGTALAADDIVAGAYYTLIYNGTSFQLSGGGGGSVPLATDTTPGIMKLYTTTDANNTDGSLTQDAVVQGLSAKQDELVSGTNIKTINFTSIVGSGDIAVQPVLVSGTNIKTVNGTTLLGSGNVAAGTVTSIATTTPINGGTITGTGTIGIDNAAADGSTKGAASFTAADFNSTAGNISIDYTNGQSASGSTKGFLPSADFTTFNNKQAALVSGTNIKTVNSTTLLGSGDLSVGTVTSIATTSPITGGTITGTGTIAINNAAADGSTKGAASFTAADFDATSGNISIDYTNGAQHVDTELTALAGTTSAANKLPYYTGSGTATTTDLSSFARTFLDDADAATVRATIGASEFLVYKNNVSSSVTGTTAETKLFSSLLIPGGTLQANDVMHILLYFSKSGTAGTQTIRVYFNTSDAIGGTQVAVNAGSTANTWTPLDRHGIFKNSVSSQVWYNLSNSVSDIVGTNAAKLSTSINFAVDQYIIITCQLSSSADTAQSESVIIEVTR